MTRVTFQEKYYPAVKETLYQAKLENGLTVSLLPKNDFNEVYGVVTVYVGSVDIEFTARDSKKKTYPKGIAHFLEHKLFERENSEVLEHKLFERENSEDIMAAFTKLGADSNALQALQIQVIFFQPLTMSLIVWTCLTSLLLALTLLKNLLNEKRILFSKNAKCIRMILILACSLKHLQIYIRKLH